MPHLTPEMKEELRRASDVKFAVAEQDRLDHQQTINAAATNIAAILVSLNMAERRRVVSAAYLLIGDDGKPAPATRGHA